MDRQTLKLLFNYDAWANHLILRALRSIPPHHLHKPFPGIGLRTISETAAHIVAAQELWYSRWKGESPKAIKNASDYSSLEHLEEEARRLDTAIQQLLDSLSPSDLASPLSYTTTDGTSYSAPLWSQMAHVINHGTDHRSQLCSMLSMLGYDAPVLDMIVFFRNRS